MEDSGASSGGISTVEHGGMTITSVGESEAGVREALTRGDASKATDEESEKPAKEAKSDKPKRLSPSDHASELGKLGGKAAAEKRAAEAREAKPQEKPEAAEAPAEEEGEEEIKSPRVKKRIEQATRQAAEAKRALESAHRERERERAQYEARLAAMEQGRPRQEARDGAGERREGPAQDDSGKPREEDFERYSDYLDARDQWNRSEWNREQERKQYGERVQGTMKTHVDTFVGALNEHPGLYDELDPSLVTVAPYFFMAPDAPVTADNLLMAEVVFAGKQGPKILKYLSEQPEALKYLRSLQAHEDIRVEVKYLARVLGSAPDATAGDPPGNGDRAPKREASKASPPVRPVTGAPPIADGDGAPRDEEDFDAWYERRKKR